MRVFGKAKLMDIKSFVNRLRRDQHADPKVLERIARDLLDEVLGYFEDNWYGGSLSPDPRDRSEFATLKFDYEVTITEDQVILRVHTDNWLWNRIDEGYGERVTKKVEKFYPLLSQRTTPGELVFKGEPQYADEPVYVAPGTTMSGLEPRHWRQAIGDELLARFRAEYPDIQVEISLE